MRWAIQCLEHELAKKLDEAAEIDRELRQLRTLQPRDPADGYPPAVSVPVTSAATEVAGERVGVGPDAAAPSGMQRPASAAVLEEFVCVHCDRPFGSQRGLSKHANAAHAIGKRSFDPQKARDAAAAAA